MSVMQPAEMTDEQLNAAVAFEVMGWTNLTPPDWQGGMYGHPPDGSAHWHRKALRVGPGVPHYATDYAAAFEVVERMRESGWTLMLMYYRNDEDGNRAYFIGDDGAVSAEAISVTRSICEAALQAVRGET